MQLPESGSLYKQYFFEQIPDAFNVVYLQTIVFADLFFNKFIWGVSNILFDKSISVCNRGHNDAEPLFYVHIS